MTAPASRVPLSVLELSPIAAGQSSAEALRTSIELARRAEAAGYRRFWLGEHHLNDGIAGAAPHVLLSHVAEATRTIRLGTAVTALGNYQPIQIAESIGVLAALHPGRVDLGLGRSATGKAGPTVPIVDRADLRVGDLLVPSPPPPIDPQTNPRVHLHEKAFRRTGATSASFIDDVEELLSYFRGDDDAMRVHPAYGRDVEVWVHGTTAGESARVAGRLGLPFGANFHANPSGVIDAVTAYREAFQPGALAEPHVAVSVDVLVAPTKAEATWAARGFGEWVLSIRRLTGATPYPKPEDARNDDWSDAEFDLIRDRILSRFVGDPDTVAGDLDALQRAVGADEIVTTTIAADPGVRIRSFELLAESWSRG